MFQKIINFIKYHNAMAIAVSLIFVLSFSAMASETVRDTVIGEKIETVQGIDNSQLLASDLDNLNLKLTIINVVQDNQNYYVDYQFKTLAIKDNVWQSVLKNKRLTVSKAFLAESDLGLYVQEELGEVIDYELSYLKEVQTIQKRKGKTEIVKTTEYTGLIGLALNVKNKIFPGYEPVVKPLAIEIAQVSEPIIELIEESSTEQSVVTNPEVPGDPLAPPDTTIDSQPLPATTSLEAIFTFYSTDQYATFQCKVNLQDWQNCTSPKTYSGLVPGDYAFQVFSTNPQGNYDATPATFSWLIIEENSGDELSSFPEETATSTDEIATSTDETIVSEDQVATSTDQTATTTDETIVSDDQTATSTDETATSTDLTSSPQAEECQLQLFYLDSDNDGYGDLNNATSTCEQPVNYTTNGTDCNDSDPNINPAVTEVCDSIDNNCDGQIDENCPTEPITDMATATDIVITDITDTATTTAATTD